MATRTSTRLATLVLVVGPFGMSASTCLAQDPLRGWAESGRVEITAVHGWGIAVGIDLWKEKSPPDGLFDRVYLLQAFGLKPSEMPWIFEHATVLESEQGLRVVALEEKFDLRLELADGQALMAPGGAGDDGVFRYRGFGLSRRDGLQWQAPLESAFLAAHPPIDPRIFTAESCASGGTGATSCSVTNRLGGCSVDCSGGFYACCNPAGPFSEPDCSCVSDPSGGVGGGGGGTGGGTGGGGGGGGLCFIGPVGFCPLSCMVCITLY